MKMSSGQLGVRQCLFCSGTFWDAVELETNAPALLHSTPQCSRFDDLDPIDFLSAYRMKLESLATVAVNARNSLYDVYIGRPSQWGNPYVRRGGKSNFDVTQVDDPIAEYEKYVRSSKALMDDLPQLRGKRLGCYCKKPCHGDVLVKLVKERYA